MSGSKTPPEGSEGPVQGSRQALYHWHRYKKPWRRESGPEQPLDRYKWRTSARLAPEGKGHSAEPRQLKMLSLPRFSTTATPVDQTSARTGSLRRILPFLRSMSEPGTTATSDPEKTALRKAGSDAERRAPSISSFITSFQRRISRVLRDEPEPAGPASGRRRNV
eukprot:superscaffoldBa00007531_g22622